MAEVDALADRLDGYQPFHAVRADLRRRAGLRDAALADLHRAVELAPTAAVAAHLRSVAASLRET